MIIVRFFSSFCSSENCFDVFQRVLSLIDVPEWNTKIRFTNGEDYTHAVILNTAMPNLTIPKSNVLGLAFEPPVFLGLSRTFVAYAQKHIGQYYIGEKGNLPDPFVEYHGFMWHVPMPLSLPPVKSLMSIIFSNKKSAPGHKYRHQLVQAILASDLPIDIYGNGCSTLVSSPDPRIKGAFSETEPYQGYQFSIAIENFAIPTYFSEKFTNCLMYHVTPVYYGCTQVDRFFPGHYVRLSGKVDEDMELLRQICYQPSLFVKPIDRIDVIKKMCLIRHLVELFSA